MDKLIELVEGPRQLLFSHLDIAVALIESYKWVGEISYVVKLDQIDQLLVPIATDLGLGLSLLKVSINYILYYCSPLGLIIYIYIFAVYCITILSISIRFTIIWSAKYSFETHDFDDWRNISSTMGIRFRLDTSNDYFPSYLHSMHSCTKEVSSIYRISLGDGLYGSLSRVPNVCLISFRKF